MYVQSMHRFSNNKNRHSDNQLDVTKAKRNLPVRLKIIPLNVVTRKPAHFYAHECPYCPPTKLY